MISRSTEIKIQKITNLIAIFLGAVIIGSTVAMFLLIDDIKKENRKMLEETERLYKTYNIRVE